jgi:hypothetical protein
LTRRRFPARWTVEDTGAAFVVKDGGSQTHTTSRHQRFGSFVARLSPRCAGQPQIKSVIKHVIKYEPERPNGDLRGDNDGENHDPGTAGLEVPTFVGLRFDHW